jgi:hypothetical protein
MGDVSGWRRRFWDCLGSQLIEARGLWCDGGSVGELLVGTPPPERQRPIQRFEGHGRLLFGPGGRSPGGARSGSSPAGPGGIRADNRRSPSRSTTRLVRAGDAAGIPGNAAPRRDRRAWHRTTATPPTRRAAGSDLALRSARRAGAAGARCAGRRARRCQPLPRADRGRRSPRCTFRRMPNSLSLPEATALRHAGPWWRRPIWRVAGRLGRSGAG